MSQLTEHMAEWPDEYLDVTPSSTKTGWAATFRDDAGKVTGRYWYDSEEEAQDEIDEALR